MLWELLTACREEVTAKEIEFIRLLRSNDPAIGYNQVAEIMIDGRAFVE